ncbi:MAG: laccase, partial [Treponema sp.]|nr:laccase [Treponema sp.]
MLNPDSYITGSFYLGGKLLTNAPKWGMSLRQAGNMRFRWNETNPVRDAFLKQVAGADHYIVPVELIHSKKV